MQRRDLLRAGLAAAVNSKGNPLTQLAWRFGVPTTETDDDNYVVHEADGRRLPDAELARITRAFDKVLERAEAHRPNARGR